MKPRAIQDPIFVRTAIFQEHEAYGFMQSFSWIVSITKGMIHLVKIDRFQTQREKASSFVALLDSSSACLASINSCTRLALQGCDRTSSRICMVSRPGCWLSSLPFSSLFAARDRVRHSVSWHNFPGSKKKSICGHKRLIPTNKQKTVKLVVGVCHVILTRVLGHQVQQSLPPRFNQVRAPRGGAFFKFQNCYQ